jgi:hypothetical protein
MQFPAFDFVQGIEDRKRDAALGVGESMQVGQEFSIGKR